MEDNEIFVSVIVPVYNTEKYIGECLESLINQTYKSYEIIIIDDGSKDNSLKICKIYKEKDIRISIYTQENKGVSSARNKGLEMAKGKYIIFVDSDDYCDRNMLKIISENIKDNCFMSFGYIKKYKKNERVICGKSMLLNDKKNIEENIFLNPKIGGYICNKVFSNEIIKKNKLKFNNSLHYSEDLLFILEYIKYCNELLNLDIAPYYYRMRKSSVSYDYINKKNSSILSLYSKLIEEYNKNEKIKKRLKYEYLVNYNLMKINKNIENIKWDIVNDERKIIKDYKLSFTRYLKYFIVYKHISIYKMIKKIKNVIEGAYE